MVPDCGRARDAGRTIGADQRPAPSIVETPVKDPDARVREAFDKGWSVIVWNDPVNLMSYVVFVFMKVLGFTKERATRHMLDVHHKGKSCVAIAGIPPAAADPPACRRKRWPSGPARCTHSRARTCY